MIYFYSVLCKNATVRLEIYFYTVTIIVSFRYRVKEKTEDFRITSKTKRYGVTI